LLTFRIASVGIDPFGEEFTPPEGTSATTLVAVRSRRMLSASNVQQHACGAAWRLQLARIIYVEDDDIMGEAVKEILTAAGHLIGVVSHGTLGADTVVFKKPDLAIIDLSLPGTNGVDVIKHLRRRAAMYMMPILVLTGNRTANAAEAAMEAGANDVMTKPFSPPELVACITQLLKNSPLTVKHD
jgi:two-component system response regulator MtrA